jgi:1-acyl-sn-glycerol-3-phosphate acyltransferase
LIRALPEDLCFVAKKELRAHILIRVFLERIGTLFVERFEAGGGVEAAKAMAAAARSGAKLMVFPEGTFTRRPGLLDFRMGAFLSAAEAQVPVVPVAIQGTRSILRDGQWLPRRGPVSIGVAETLLPEGSGFHAAVCLRDRARLEILRLCREPDLAGEHTILSKL